jgi:phosphoglycerol transferase
MKKIKELKKSKKLKKVQKIVSKILFILLISFADTVICAYYYIKTFLGDISFFQLYYHLKNGGTNSIATSGSSYVVLSAIIDCIPLIILLITIEVFLFTRWKKYRVFLKSKKKGKEYNVFPTIFSKYRIITSIIIIVISLSIFFDYIHYKDYIDTKSSKTDIYEKYYIDTNKVDISFKGKKRNLIYIYLESMESSLFSKKNNGLFEESRIPELEKLAENNINFSQNNGLGGMYDVDGYTMSAIVSNTSSTPITVGCGNDCIEYGDIVEKVRTIGDVLTDEGYNVEFIQGSDSTFAGLKQYLTKHSNQKIYDYNTAIEKGFIDKDYYEWWGFEDKKLFEISKSEITKLAEKDKPFAVSLITMDTHFPNGYQDDSCKEKFDDEMSNSYLCSSNKVYKFVQWIKKQDFYNDTMIVITGDHKTMQSSYYSKDSGERSVYNVFINSKKEDINSKNRIVTNYDVYPTVLSGLGADIKGNRIGFGTNLFSNEKTIPEMIGIDTFNKEKNKSSDYYNKNISKKKKRKKAE